MTQKFYFDRFYNHFFGHSTLYFAYHLQYKLLDRGLLEVSLGVSKLSNSLIKWFQSIFTGYILHYLLLLISNIFLIGFCNLLFKSSVFLIVLSTFFLIASKNFDKEVKNFKQKRIKDWQRWDYYFLIFLFILISGFLIYFFFPYISKGMLDFVAGFRSTIPRDFDAERLEIIKQKIEILQKGKRYLSDHLYSTPTNHAMMSVIVEDIINHITLFIQKYPMSPEFLEAFNVLLKRAKLFAPAILNLEGQVPQGSLPALVPYDLLVAKIFQLAGDYQALIYTFFNKTMILHHLAIDFWPENIENVPTGLRTTMKVIRGIQIVRDNSTWWITRYGRRGYTHRK